MEHSLNFKKLPSFEEVMKTGILPVWQPYGFSTHEICRLIGLHYNVKTSHTGTLDPMASGVVIILLGETRLKKYEYATWLKTYTFDVVLGFQTDTFDGLGLITNKCSFESVGALSSSSFDFDRLSLDTSSIDKLKIDEFTKESIQKACSAFVGEYTQTVPSYAAIKFKGLPLHVHARTGTIDSAALPKRSGFIYSLRVVDYNLVNISDISSSLVSKIKLIDGDFRQSETTGQWQSFKGSTLIVPVVKLCVTMSKGLYVRSLSQDLCVTLKTKGFVSNIVRASNGCYNIHNSFSIN